MKATTLTLAGDTRPAPDAGPRSFVCLGTPRGGTSMVAGVMAHLGIFMGEDYRDNVEDPAFNIDFFDGDYDAFIASARETAAARSAAHPVWGWKYPRAERYLADLVEALPAPHLIVVYRDPVPSAIRAVGQRRFSPEERIANAKKTLRNRLQMQLANLDMVEALNLPSLMVSYEAAIQRPEMFLQEMADFCQLEVPENKSEILNFMEPGSYKQVELG